MINNFFKHTLILVILISNLSAKEIMSKSTMTNEEWMTLAKENKIEFTKKFFNSLNQETMDLVNIFYHPNAKFYDPIGNHEGVNSIKKYYAGIYEPVTKIKFDYDEPFMNNEQLAFPWKMTYCSSKLNKGKPIVVNGISRIKFDPVTHQAIYHRDYFDMGQMVYEEVPLLGSVVKWIKNKLKSE